MNIDEFWEHYSKVYFGEKSGYLRECRAPIKAFAEAYAEQKVWAYWSGDERLVICDEVPEVCSACGKYPNETFVFPCPVCHPKEIENEAQDYDGKNYGWPVTSTGTKDSSGGKPLC